MTNVLIYPREGRKLYFNKKASQKQAQEIIDYLDGKLEMFPARPWFLWPTEYPGMVNQAFGVNYEYYKRFDLPGHEGIDMRAFLGTNIYCVYDGEVSIQGVSNAYGNQIRIKSVIEGAEYEHIYAHLDKPAYFKVGDKVTQGAILGPAGSTGNSTGPHLHFTLKKKGATANKETNYRADIIDPTKFFKELQ